MNNRASGLKAVTGLNASPNTIDELLSTNLILRIGFKDEDSRVIALKMKQAEEAGAKVINLCSGENSVGFLKEIAKAIIDSGKAKKVAGYDEFAASVASVKVSDRGKPSRPVSGSEESYDSISAELPDGGRRYSCS